MTKLLLCLLGMTLCSASCYAQTPPAGTITQAQARDEKPRTWRDKTGKFSISARLVEAKQGQVRLEKQDGSTIAVEIEALSVADKQYLQAFALANVDELPLHEAIAAQLIKIEIQDYAQEKLQLLVRPRSQTPLPKLTVPPGTWIELEGFARAGRLYVVDKRSVDPNGDTFGGPGGLAHVTAIPAELKASVPVIETVAVRGRSAKAVNHTTVSRAGFDESAARIFGKEDDPGREQVMNLAAALLMLENRDLNLDQFQAYIERTFTGRMSASQKAKFSPNNRRTVLYIWEATAEHLKMGEHLFEKSQASTDIAAADATSASPNLSKSTPLAEAVERGFVTIGGRKGLNGRVIVRLARTAQAPSGPLRVTVPAGTVLEIDDGRQDQPMTVYPLYDEVIELFGKVEGGAQLPVLYGSYKRKLKTTKPLGIRPRFDPKVQALFEERPPAHYLQMAIEAVLLDQSDLTRDQIQFHVTTVGVPGEPSTLAVTDELVEAARRRLAGDTTASVESSPSAAHDKPAAPGSGAKRDEQQRAAMAQKNRSNSNAAAKPGASKAQGDQFGNLRELMQKFQPEDPEADLVGTWVALPEAEARKFVEPMMTRLFEQIAVSQDKTLSAAERNLIAAQAKAAQANLKVFTGTVRFEANQQFRGQLTGRHAAGAGNLAGRWKYDNGDGFKLTTSGTGVALDITQLVYVAEGRLAFLGAGGPRSRAIIVLKKQN